MRIYYQPTKIIQNSAITIGSFDGIHRGHQKVIARLLKVAQQKHTRAGIITFNPCPQTVLYPDFHYILTPMSEKKAILSGLGVDFLFLLKFNQTMQNLSPTAFIKSQILHLFHPKTIVIGYDHRFGKNGQGDVELLKKLAAEFNFELVIVPEFQFAGKPIKSTRIRERLLLGDVKTANQLLGRNYVIIGKVTRGLGIGRKLGFPTVNLKIKESEKLIPADGVYAVFVWYQAKKYMGAMNIGLRPTFGADTRTIEISLIGLQRNLYGAQLKVELIERLRTERTFRDAKSLAQQIKKDIEHTKNSLTTKFYAKG